MATACTSVLVLRLSPPADRGSLAALQLSDLFGQSVTIGLGGVLSPCWAGRRLDTAERPAHRALLVGASLVSRRAS